MAESAEGTDTSEHDAFVVEQDEGDLEAMLALQADLASEEGVYVRGGQGSFDGANHTPAAASPPPSGPLAARLRDIGEYYDHPGWYGEYPGRQLFRLRHRQDELDSRMIGLLRSPRLSDDIPSPPSRGYTPSDSSVSADPEQERRAWLQANLRQLRQRVDVAMDVAGLSRRCRS